MSRPALALSARMVYQVVVSSGCRRDIKRTSIPFGKLRLPPVQKAKPTAKVNLSDYLPALKQFGTYTMLLVTLTLSLLPLTTALAGPFTPFNPLTAILPQWQDHAQSLNRILCYIPPSTSPLQDVINIETALNTSPTNSCATDSLIVFPGPTYHITAPLTTLSLNNTWIYILGTFPWSVDIPYWLESSMPIGFQNQSTVWYFGGDNVVIDGFNKGSLDGNGQAWYDWAKGGSNLANRPMMINWRGLRNSTVRRMRFVQSQMWTMATTRCQNVLFEDIYVNNTSNSTHNTLNTDGVDTIYSDNITFSRWDITCGGDAIALKGNSSNIFVYDSIFRGGQGLAIGSLGQYKVQTEYISTFHGRNITMYDTNYGIYIKTWPGLQNGYPPNGGGGGFGHGKSIVMEDITLHGTRTAPICLWQCEHYEGEMGEDCDSSEFSFSGLRFKGWKGMVDEGVDLAMSLRCSEGGDGCSDVEVERFRVKNDVGGMLSEWLCSNTHAKTGFGCEPFPEDDVEALESD